MRIMRTIAPALIELTGLLAANANAQIVINEIVINERIYLDNGPADTGEFIELYNAGAAPVDLTNWAIASYDLLNGSLVSLYPLLNGTVNPGDYFVIGQTGVTNLDYDLGFSPLWTDNAARVLELKDSSANTIDAIAYEIYRTGNTGLNNATAAQKAQFGSGYQGRLFTLTDRPETIPKSLSRYRDGRDTNSTGYDFANLPLTPGESNNVPLVARHTVPNVNDLNIATEVPGYHASFDLPKVIDPTINDGTFNRRVLPASPQGGNAIVAWDEEGGGNTIYSNELTNSFDLYAYFNTEPLGIPGDDQHYEMTTYGIGSSDARASIANPLGIFTGPGTSTTVTDSSNAGIGWFYQKHQFGANNSSTLMLIDFGDGGNSHPNAEEWEIIEQIDLSQFSSGWFRLGIDYDPETGIVVARFGSQTYQFTTAEDLLGAFYVGFREQSNITSANFHLHNPPVFDQFLAGDYDKDGDVDNDDYDVWKNTFGGTLSTAGADADGNSDGTISAADYVVWRDNLQPMVVVAGQVAVPEPAGALLLLFGLVALCIQRRGAKG